ncbi:MAG: family N-acetyltransferase [Devosia sp.]|uniref:GNAT family N-acetyltransferase n=1 Tax=Devosia sp. TaxID=1871048 RepID=UPI00261A69DC|nr:GNAT family N-acetyltransferase [Devosia sp.]MDB5530810.1 family N-acetyltransferase [Devosia sp.]
MDYSIWMLNAADVTAYRAVRHEALVNHPDAYASSADSFAARGDEDLAALLGQMAFFGVFAEGSLAGLVAFGQTQGEREQHRGWLYQVYVQPRLRGTGAGLALIETAVAHASSRVIQLHLMVGAHNVPAIRLYEKAGFKTYGTDPRCLLVNGRYIDEHMMVRFFDEAPGKTDNE